MAIATTIQHYLEHQQVPYEVLELVPFDSLLQAAHNGNIPAAAMVKVGVLRDRVGLVMVVMPATRDLNLAALSRLLHRRLEFPSEAEVKAQFADCLSHFIPPLGEPYGVRTLIDDSLLTPDTLYFASGNEREVIRVSNRVFHDLMAHAWLAADFTHGIDDPHAARDVVAGDEEGQPPPAIADLQTRLAELHRLPAMPEMAQRLLALRANAKAGAEELARVVELDPSLCAQVLRYASSPFFGYSGHVDSAHTAIARVLGFDMVMDLALGIAMGKSFRIPTMGPLGLQAHWRHAIYSAALVQGLARELPRELRLPGGLAYLAGLLHNFGHLLMGHLFKREFLLLNNVVTKHPQTPIPDLERQTLGVDHGSLGAWLMATWGLPKELIVAAREHHNPDYDGPHAVYAQLVLVADHVLASHGLGDVRASEPPAAVMAALGLDELKTLMVMNRILEGCEGLNTMAQQIAA